MRTRLVLCLVASGCGRLAFERDAPPDTETPPQDVAPRDGDLSALLAGCELRLEMDELDWSTEAVGDACGGDHPGTAIGGAITTADPERGRVGEFAGGTSCVEIADHPALRGGGGFSIAAWIRPTQLAPSSFGIVSKRFDFGSGTAYSLFVWDDATGENRLYLDVDGEDDRFALPTDNFVGAWRHVAVVFDGARPPAMRSRLFVDGAFRSFAPEASATIPAPMPAPGVSVGCLPLGGPAQAMVGRIDDVVYWSRALDDAEIAAWYAATGG